MVNIKKVFQQFNSLDEQKQYQVLVSLFDVIRNKNENCAYIAKKLHDLPGIFSRELMTGIYGDTLNLYDNTIKKEKKLGRAKMERSVQIIREIKKREEERRAELDVDSLLRSI